MVLQDFGLLSHFIVFDSHPLILPLFQVIVVEISFNQPKCQTAEHEDSNSKN
jgi:hypothetical protein